MRSHWAGPAFALFCVSTLAAALEPEGAAPRSAATPTPLEAVVRRWLDAVGGERKAQKVKAVVIRSDISEDGVMGRVEERLDRDAWRRVTTEGTRTREEACADGAAWVRDWNGKVAELRGRDRRDQLTEAYIEALLYGGAARGIVASGETELLGEDESHTSALLRFAPKDGVPFELFLDKATALPVKVVRKPYNDTITLAPGDWRTVKGLKVPFSLRETAGDENAASTTTVREVVLDGGRAGSPIGRPQEGAKDYRFTAGHSALGIPFNFENDHLMVSGRVNGSKPLWFMLDTGAEATIVNKARIAELGVEPFGASSINGGGNSTDFAYAEVARFEVGGAALLNQRDGVIDLSGLEKIYGMPMGGLLGYDFFSRFVVRVNYDTKTIDLLEPSEYVYQGSGATVPFVLEGKCPHVASSISVPTVPPIEADLIVDAGAADNVNLTSPFVKANRLLELARKTPAGGPNTMAGSEKEFFAQTSVRGRLSGLTLGGATLKDIPCNLMVGTKGAYASTSFSGTIGEGVLHRFNTVYDYSRSAVILEPNAEHAKPFPARKTFGATFLSDGPDYTRFTVTGVRKASPAEAAGLKKDDVVVAADGKAASEMRLADVRKIITDEGAHHVLTIDRGGESVTIDLLVTLVPIDEN
jgi:aspartyl protease/PDZ domain-containing protein